MNWLTQKCSPDCWDAREQNRNYVDGTPPVDHTKTFNTPGFHNPTQKEGEPGSGKCVDDITSPGYTGNGNCFPPQYGWSKNVVDHYCMPDCKCECPGGGCTDDNNPNDCVWDTMLKRWSKSVPGKHELDHKCVNDEATLSSKMFSLISSGIILVAITNM